MEGRVVCAISTNHSNSDGGFNPFKEKSIGEGLMRFDFHMITFPFTLLAIRFYKYLTISLLSSMAFYYIKQHASK
jgi:hypothetical protein